MGWGGGTEPENCIAWWLISLPPGSVFHRPGSSLPPVDLSFFFFFFVFLLLVSLSHHFAASVLFLCHSSLYSLLLLAKSLPLSRQLSPPPLLSISVSLSPFPCTHCFLSSSRADLARAFVLVLSLGFKKKKT